MLKRQLNNVQGHGWHPSLQKAVIGRQTDCTLDCTRTGTTSVANSPRLEAAHEELEAECPCPIAFEARPSYSLVRKALRGRHRGLRREGYSSGIMTISWQSN